MSHYSTLPSVTQTTETFDDVHTPSNPYCGDPDCWCHVNSAYHEIVTDRTISFDEQEDMILAFHELPYGGGN